MWRCVFLSCDGVSFCRVPMAAAPIVTWRGGACDDMCSDGQSPWLIPWFADSDGICSGATKKTFGTKKAEQIGIKRTKNCRKFAKKVDANLAKISRNSVEKLSWFRWFSYREYLFLVLFQPCIAGCVHPCDGGGGAHCHMGLVAVCRCGRGACDDICSYEEVLYFSLI